MEFMVTYIYKCIHKTVKRADNRKNTTIFFFCELKANKHFFYILVLPKTINKKHHFNIQCFPFLLMAE